MNKDFHPLCVSETQDEIGGQAKTIRFVVPAELQDRFTWRAGQHITVRFTIGGKEERRSYSISSSPYSGNPLQITVKRVKDGLVSNHINDNLNVGDVVEVIPPFGGFCLDPGEKLRRTHYFIGAGSGITPLFSMAKTVLCAELNSVAHLVYGNKNADSIIFRDAFDALMAEHPDRLTVQHILSDPSWLSSFAYWRRGIVDLAAIEALIAENPPYAQDAQYYICGPGKMNKAVKEALIGLDVTGDRIHMENYGGDILPDLTITGMAAKAKITLNGQISNVSIAKDQTILEAVRAANINPPFSCQSGVCGACRAKLTGGEVHMRARMALEDTDLSNGAVLTCQAVAISPKIEINYDQ